MKRFIIFVVALVSFAYVSFAKTERCDKYVFTNLGITQDLLNGGMITHSFICDTEKDVLNLIQQSELGEPCEKFSSSITDVYLVAFVDYDIDDFISVVVINKDNFYFFQLER